MGNNLAEEKKGKPTDISDLPEGLRELVEIPLGSVAKTGAIPQSTAQKAPGNQNAAKPRESQNAAPALIAAAKTDTILLPAHSNAQQPAQSRPKTQKEQELDAMIVRRQAIIEQLKSKNPLVVEARKNLAAIVPAIQGAGASHTLRLAGEAEHIEFLIATEADTPKKEKELLKRLRLIKQELSKHKEIDDSRKAVEAGRSVLHSLMQDVKSLERELAEVRTKCDTAYAAVLAERKSAYEGRQKGREERQHKRDESERRRFSELQERVHTEKKREYDSEMQKYMKNYDDTVSMEEIVQFEKKEKKEDKKEESE
jgi:hypothetical protein